MTHSKIAAPHTPHRNITLIVLAIAIASGLSAVAAAQTPPPAIAPAVAPSTLPFNGIAHIAIRVKDIAASVAFYNKLGFQQAFAMTRGDVVTQSFVKIDDRQFIELYPIAPDNPNQGTPEFLHLCFEGVDLNAIHDAYVAEGLTPITVRKAGAGNLLFTLKGPQQFSSPQNIEYTQYMPESLHSKDFGQHLSPDRVADKMVLVTLAMQDPAAARAFYLDKLGFTASAKDPMVLNLPGTSGQQVQIVPVDALGAKSSIILTTPSIRNAETALTNQKVPFIPAKPKAGSATIVTDPDGNLINIIAAPR